MLKQEKKSAQHIILWTHFQDYKWLIMIKKIDRYQCINGNMVIRYTQLDQNFERARLFSKKMA